MRAGGMTTILQEIAFKEYLLGKKVLYVSPRHELTRLAKNVFSYKESVSQYVPMTGAKIDCATVSGDNYHIGFSCSTISKRYDLIIVDEISLDTDLLNVLKVVGDYCQYIMKGDCKAIVAFTPRQYKSELKNESIRKALEEYEFDGNLFRYSELTGTQLKRLKDSLKYLFYTDDEETEDFWTNEPVLQQIKECLGIL
jgi:hypothetical protein